MAPVKKAKAGSFMNKMKKQGAAMAKQAQSQGKAMAATAKAQGPGMMAQIQAQAKAASNKAKAAAPGIMAQAKAAANKAQSQVKAAANKAKAAAPGMMAQAKAVANKAKAAAPGVMAQAKAVANKATAPGATNVGNKPKNNSAVKKVANAMPSNGRANFKGKAIANKVQADGRRMAENTTTQTLAAIEKGRNMAKKAHRQAINMATQAHNQALEKARMEAQANGLQFGEEMPMNYMDNMGRRIMQGPNGGAYVNMPGGARNYRPNAAFKNQVGSGMVTPVNGQSGLPQNLRY
jgi:colicin import membrane protein